MPRPTQQLHIDFETYCDLDLKKVGVYRYTAHPSFKVLAVAWKLRGYTWSTYCQAQQQTMPPALLQLLKDPDVQAHAWNAAFENAVLAAHSVFVANPISCTMQRALAYGLPGKLETAAAALGVAAQKDMAGHRLMLRMSKPLKPGSKTVWEQKDFVALADYCGKDVDAEAAVSDVIPELQPEEWELSQLDTLMNTTGDLGIDVVRVGDLEMLAKAAEGAEAARCAVLTGGAVTKPGTQTKRLLKWLEGEGLVLGDTQRATIEEALGSLMDFDAKACEVLRIRLRAARASTNKLRAMLDRADPGIWALRGQFQFCGAGRTGRWSGRGVQVQNLPRPPKGFSPNLFHDMVKQVIAGNNGITGLDAIAPAPILDCVSWSLRSCLKASSPVDTLWSIDFSQIEARVLAWLAGQQDILAVFASGKDVYTWAAGQFGSDNRQLGKVLVLALGYGMGAIKLRETAWKSYQVKMTPSQAELFKNEWRHRNDKITTFWIEIEHAARHAILKRGQVFAVGGSGIALCCTPRTLQMRLPSGRVLYYHKPRIDRGNGELSYWGTEVGGQWTQQRTWGGKLAENATQAAARDIMSEAMLRVWRRMKLVPCMTVHDELVYAQVKASRVLEAIVLEPPPWAGGLPLAGESKLMSRYGVLDKSP